MRWLRRRRARRLLDAEPITATHLPQYPGLEPDERQRLDEDTEWLLRTRDWEAARGFSLTARMQVTIAAHAALLLLGLDRDVYRDVRAVVVHPRTITHRGPRSTTMRGVVADGPLRVLGHTPDRRGPVVISWRAVESDLRRPDRGHSVAVHEFAHKIDVADGLFDGTPEITTRPDRAEWVRVCTTEYRRLRRRNEPDPVLRRYATTNPSEFFAVATEAFLFQPRLLAEHKPALYGVFRDYYGQDPARRPPLDPPPG